MGGKVLSVACSALSVMVRLFSLRATAYHVELLFRQAASKHGLPHKIFDDEETGYTPKRSVTYLRRCTGPVAGTPHRLARIDAQHYIAFSSGLQFSR
ncbi:uncharacterized protein B0H18DRAFT_71745 [Fomitopsis serialis]|uniref:uncharacterized protein n=1 Tax=Fomitopsis serialis TaxID=139415 RepID=UPI0020073863|nr:uncharacterized protein B0H18DRAFT_71745 [Neoantrodia serialis]KAH9931953.1 hypothetical protein B0H18DRAFT_71745 [Neoantrodia serialis]